LQADDNSKYYKNSKLGGYLECNQTLKYLFFEKVRWSPKQN